jgi:aspartokinase
MAVRIGQPFWRTNLYGGNYMKRVYILLNHKPTERQLADLALFAGEEIEVVEPKQEVKDIWADISPEFDEYCRYNIAKFILKDILEKNIDFVWVQGENVTVYHLVELLKKKEIIAIAATTKRKTIEEQLADGTTKKTSIFEHCRFVLYWF